MATLKINVYMYSEAHFCHCRTDMTLGLATTLSSYPRDWNSKYTLHIRALNNINTKLGFNNNNNAINVSLKTESSRNKIERLITHIYIYIYIYIYIHTKEKDNECYIKWLPQVLSTRTYVNLTSRFATTNSCTLMLQKLTQFWMTTYQ